VFTVNPEKRGAARGARATPASSPDPNHEAYLNDFTSDAESQYLTNANAVTKEVYERVNSGGEFFLTSTTMEGIYAIRVVGANPMAEEKYIKRVFEVLVQTAEKVLEKGR
jgi:aromatic-L-amino-acid decarboxylase